MAEQRILILSASIGMGHTRAGLALKAAFQAMDGVENVRHEDVLEFSNSAFRTLYAKSYADLVDKAPEFLGWLYERADLAPKEIKQAFAFQRLNAFPLIELVRTFAPQIIVTTHPLAADMISSLICKGQIQAQHAIVVTDFDIHSVWLCNHYSRYFVGLNETKVHLERLGYDSSKIKVSGIPIHPIFCQHKDKHSMRMKHGLLPNRLTFLLSAGGFGMGPVEKILQSLESVHAEFQIVAVCGHNQNLQDHIQGLFPSGAIGANGLIKVIGFSDQMDELMSASDLIIGKPGGLTSSEAMAKGLLFVIMYPIPGQEERNADHLLEENVAIRCNNLSTVGYKIDQLLGNKERWNYMLASVKRMAKPDAAEFIARDLMELANSGYASSVHPVDHVCLEGMPGEDLAPSERPSTHVYRGIE